MRILVGVLLLFLSRSLCAQSDQEETEHFERRVRPLLIDRCIACHGSNRQEGGLRLDSSDAFRRGGDSGPIVDFRQPDSSRLLIAVRRTSDLKMPPNDKRKLTQREIDDLQRWIARGAVWPHATSRSSLEKSPHSHWAFQPIRRPPVPSVKQIDWTRTPIDRFLLARLEASRIKPSEPTSRRIWLRRVTFSLTGLPPTPLELANFEADTSAHAYERVVDRLLSSPQYGERWARHWLDVARYADSNGLDENRAYIHAFRYRDFVIDALNRDMPFNEFLRAQIAGDLLADPRRPEGVANDQWKAQLQQLRGDRLTATGFLALGPKGLREVDGTKMQLDIIDDQVATLGKAVMGLTLECARCHDHKFDPIGTADYYALAGVFKSTRTMSRIVDNRGKGNGLWLEQDVLTIRAQQGGRQPAAKAKVMSVSEGKPVNERIHRRGSHLDLGREVARGVPAVLTHEAPLPPIKAGDSGRLQLAAWLTDPRHPLTSRVIVNRVWLWHFGTGLVDTPDNFGELGARPADARLLDWLAHEFVARGWSIKRLNRLIVLSSAYRTRGEKFGDQRLDSLHRSLIAAVGFPRRRLSAEEIRDSLLFVGRGLDQSMFGSLLKLQPRQYVNDAKTGKHLVSYDNRRRSVYQPVIRNGVYELLRTFDFPNPSLVNGRRSSTTVAPQQLLLMNSQLAIQSALGLADRLLALPLNDKQRIDLAFQIAFARPAEASERETMLLYLQRYEQSVNDKPDTGKGDLAPRRQAWKSFCQALMIASEFIYIE